MRKTAAMCSKPSVARSASKCKSSKSESSQKHKAMSYNWEPLGKTDKVIILDIDHTLVDSTGYKSSDPDRRYVLAFPDGNKITGSMRPNVKEFLSFLKKYSKEVIIWTAGTKDYAEAIVELLFEEGDYPKHVLSRNDCAMRENYCHKPIRPLSHRLGYDPSSVLIIDDTETTFTENPSNGLLIPRYLGNNEDSALIEVAKWLDAPKVRHSWGVTQLDKSSVFSK